MQQIPPPQLPSHQTELPATPTVIARLATRVRQPGRRAPLPDAVAIRPYTVPATAPPFDDQENDEGNGAVRQTADDPPGGDRAATEDAALAAAVYAVADHKESDQSQPDPPAGWPSQFAQVLAETLAGSRPVRQLTPWTTEQARKRIRQLGPMLATDQRPRVRRVMTSAPAAGVLEMTAVVGFGPRIRVLAMRLELGPPSAYRQCASRWSCTAIDSA